MTQHNRGGNRHAPRRGSRSSYARRPKSYKILCSDCGKEVITQVPPPEDKKLLCMDCFKK